MVDRLNLRKSPWVRVRAASSPLRCPYHCSYSTMDKIRISTVDNVVLERYVPPPSDTLDARPNKQRLTGQLHLVQHHLFFSPAACSSTSQTEEIWIPYPAINLLTRLPQSIEGLYPLRLRTRTFESYLLLFEKDREGGAEDVWLSIKDCAVASRLAVTRIARQLTRGQPPSNSYTLSTIGCLRRIRPVRSSILFLSHHSKPRRLSLLPHRDQAHRWHHQVPSR